MANNYAGMKIDCYAIRTARGLLTEIVLSGFNSVLERPLNADLSENALEATDFLKAMAHDGRLQILCLLLTGEKSVAEIQNMFSVRQAAASQQLSSLRLSGLIDARRDGKNIYYRIADQRVSAVVAVLYELFCDDVGDA